MAAGRGSIDRTGQRLSDPARGRGRDTGAAVGASSSFHAADLLGGDHRRGARADAGHRRRGSAAASARPGTGSPCTRHHRASAARAVPVKSIQRTKAVPRATPTPPTAKPTAAAAAAVARGGPTGGAGADVANVRIDGIEFPFPGYLNNIVRQVALNFSPDNPAANAHAEIAFLIRRDGSVVGLRFVTRSGDYAFDLEAQGALEKASPAFGPLPDGFHDDVLPVVFSFDPRLSH